MNRIFAVGVVWILTFVVGGVCSADPRRQNTQNTQAPSPPPAPSKATQRIGPGASARSYPPPANANNRAAQAAAAARSAAAAQVPLVQPASLAASSTSTYNNRGYFPYGYFGLYGYYPYGTTPYAVGYNPYTGQTYLYSALGGYYPYGYSPYAYNYGYFANPYLGYGYPGAVFANPGQLFGLGPIQQLLGGGLGLQQANAPVLANANLNPAPNGNNNANAGPIAAAGNVPPAPAPQKAAAAGTKATELAWKFIAFGDARFGDLKYNEALDRYRRAARECPSLGDAWMREGFAQAALGNYDQAAKAMRRGLDEKPDWADSNFRLDEIYGDNAADKKARVGAMVKAAEAEPNNGELALVLGIHLYCDGKQDQAAPFFRRAAQILGNDASIKPFLPKAGE